jgi:hypothetical protein
MNPKNITLDFSDSSGGLNTRDEDSIGENQVQGGTYNVKMQKKGLTIYPGAIGIAPDITITNYTRMAEFFKMANGDEYFLIVSNKKLYRVSVEDESLALVLDFSTAPLANDLEAWGKTSHNKFWCFAGHPIRYEGGNASFAIGIPITNKFTGNTPVAAASSGGSLADGVYGVKIGYAREENGTITLYSRGYDLGNVTIEGANKTISISTFNDVDVFTSIFGNSSANANKKVFWITEANGSTHFYFDSADGTLGGTAYSITSNANKNEAIQYFVDADDNYTPYDISLTDGAIEFVETHGNRLWFSISNTLYYSRVAGEAFDLERFGASAFVDIEYPIKGIFSCGPHLIVNTENGLYKIPYGDISIDNPTEKINESFYFVAPRTVCLYKNGLLGLTNGGVRFFDGIAWSENLSAQISNEIDNVSLNIVNHLPCGKIHRSKNEMEYHLCFCHKWDPTEQGNYYPDSSAYPFIFGGILNNVRFTFNLDALFSSQNPIKHWEASEPSAEYMAVDSGNNLYNVQSSASGSKVYRINDSVTYKKNIFVGGSKNNGVWNVGYSNTVQNRYWRINFKRAVVSDIFRSWFYQIRGIIISEKAVRIKIYIDNILGSDGNIVSTTYVLDPALVAGGDWGGGPVFDAATSTFDANTYFQALTDREFKIPLKMTMKGHIFHMVMDGGGEAENNVHFSINQLHILALAQKGNLR